MASTRRTSRLSAGPSAGLASTRAMFGRAALAIECSRLWAVSRSAETTPTRVPGGSWASRWSVSRCTSARSATTGTPRPLSRRSTSGRCPKLVTAAPQRSAGLRRRTAPASPPRSTLSTLTGSWASSSRPKKSSSGGLHSTRSTVDSVPEGGQPDAGHAQDAHRHVVGSHLERRPADHRVPQEVLAASRKRAGGQSRGHEHALAPPRLHVPAPLEILDGARHGVRIDAEETRQLTDARQRLLPRDAAPLDHVLQLLRQLPADRDRAVGVDLEAQRDLHTV